MSTALSITLDELMGAHPNIKMERIDFTIDEVYRVATFLFYDESIANGSKGTVIGVHGGPAFCHNYILPLKLLVNYGYRVILYDQCGCGLSSNVNDVREHAPHLLTIEYYCRELNALISHYGLEDFHLYGSSWGTMVIQEFAVMDSSERSGHLLSIMLDGALCDSHLYIHTQWRDRISTLPTCTQSLLRRLTDEGDFRSELYKLFDDTMSCMFMCRTIPKPEAYYESVRGANMEIYEAMQGASEFTTGGVLKGQPANIYRMWTRPYSL